MKCPLCGNEYFRVEIMGADPEQCDICIGANYDHDVARQRAKRIPYHKELILIARASVGGVTVGNLEVECSGYYADGDLYDQYVTINGQEVYGLLDEDVQYEIEVEIIRRLESERIIREIKAIEKELPTSKDPARLRLRRSDLDGELEILEGTA